MPILYHKKESLKVRTICLSKLIKDKKQAGVLKKMQGELERLMVKYSDKGGDYNFWESDA